MIDVRSKNQHLVVSRVNLSLKFRKSKDLPGSYDLGRLQDKNMRESIQEQLNTNLESLKFDSVEDGWNNLRKIVYEESLLCHSEDRKKSS